MDMGSRTFAVDKGVIMNVLGTILISMVFLATSWMAGYVASNEGNILGWIIIVLEIAILVFVAILLIGDIFNIVSLV